MSPAPSAVHFASPEDTVLAKLVWFRTGSEVSERQWRDVVEVIRSMAGDLDRAYFLQWAEELGVLDLWTAAEAAAVT